MQTLIEDIQFAFRSFMKTPAVCALIVMTLALGIGANAAIFSMVYNVMMAPLPFAEGERLVKVNTNNPNINRFDVQVSVATMQDYKSRSTHLSHLVEYHELSFTMLGHGVPMSLTTGTVSWDYFEMLKIRPILGRTFLPGEDEVGAAPRVVLSHHFWREMFGSDPDILGKTLQMDNDTHQVIGVLPPMASYPVKNDIWITAASSPVRSSSRTISDRNRAILTLYGKLAPGSSIEQATLELNHISESLMAKYPDSYPASQGLSNTLVPLKDEMAGQSGQTFYLLLAITGLVLLIACANVANLNLARSAARQQEFAVREALGANPARITRQVLTESTILSLLGGVLGMCLAVASSDLLSSFAAHYTSLSSEVKINWPVSLFCLAISLLTGVLSGTAVAFQKRNINESLKESSGNITASGASERLRKGLLVLQFSLAFVVITSATLLSLSLYRLNTQDTGINSSQVLTLQMGPGMSSGTLREWHDYAKDLAWGLESKTEIEQVAFTTAFPEVEGKRPLSFFQIEGRSPININERPEALNVVVSANYHQLLGIALLKGRYFLDTDDAQSPGSILINKAFADTFLSDENPIQQRISLDYGKTWLTIRGVVANSRELGADIAPVPSFYSTFDEYHRWSWLKMLIKTPQTLSQLNKIITETVLDLNANQAIDSMTTLNALKKESLSSENLVGQLVALFAILAFVIALSGVVGVVAYNISQRRKEIGIRVALGANPKRIRMHFIVQGLFLCGIGIGIGGLVMAFISPVLVKVLFDTQALNLFVYLVTGTLITLFASFAMLLPVRQATRIEPNQALREQ